MLIKSPLVLATHGVAAAIRSIRRRFGYRCSFFGRSALRLAMVVAIGAAKVPAAQAQPETLSVALTGGSDQAILEDDGDPTNGLSQIRSLDGGFPTKVFEHPYGTLVVLMRAGDDQFRVSNDLEASFTAALDLRGQNGNDSVKLGGISTAADLTFHGGNGDNLLDMVATTVNGSLKITDAAGFQSVLCIDCDVTGDVRCNSRDGGSRMSLGAIVGGMTVGGNVIINNRGYGDDEISLNFITVQGNVHLSTAHGNSDVESLFSSFRGALTVLHDSGIDTLMLGDVDVRRPVTVSSGQGATETTLIQSTFSRGVTITNTFGYDEYLIRGISTPSLKISNGDEGSLTRIESLGGSPVALNIGSIAIANEAGSHELYFAMPVPGTIGDIGVSNGDGNSITSFAGGVHVGSVSLQNTDGFHVVTMEPSSLIDGDLTIASGAGGSYLGIEDAAVAGNLSLTSASGNDEILFLGAIIDGSTDVYLEADDDLVTLSRSAFLGDLVLDGGAGEDTLGFSNDNIFGGFAIAFGFENFFQF